MSYQRFKEQVLASTTLAGGSAVLTTAAVPCLGAAEVYFHTKATNAITPTAATYEYSVDDGVTFLAADASFFETANNVAASDNSTGRVLVVSPRSSAAARLTRLPATHIRARFTGNVGASPANDITGFRVHAVAIPAA